MRRPLLATLILMLGPAAHAALIPDYVKSNLGEWLVVGDDGKPGCRIGLRGEPVGANWRAAPAPDCAARLPAVARAATWTFEGGVRLLDSSGKVLLDFQEDETTLMKTSFEAKPVFFIVKARPGMDRAPFAPALVGNWLLRRPGGPVLCPLALSRTPTDDEADLTLKTGAPCDPAIARLKLDNARVEDVALMLYGKPETSLRFEPSGPESYAKAEGGRPLEMVRAP
jgi:hypothetical protein